MAHKIKLPNQQKNVDALVIDLEAKSLTLGNAKQACLQAASISEEMSKKAYAYIQKALGIQKKNWKQNFNSDSLLVHWFGKASKKGHVKDVLNRMESAKKRINKGLTLKLRPQKDIPANARNNGGLFSPKDFRIFPKMFDHKNSSGRIDTEYMASVYIHEMLHLWFTDQKYKGVKVQSDTADDLARSEPDKARKSAENYEQFSKAVWKLP